MRKKKVGRCAAPLRSPRPGRPCAWGGGGPRTFLCGRRLAARGAHVALDVIAGSASGLLGARLAVELGSKVIGTEIKRFPDGEAYVRVAEDLAGREVVLVQTTWPDAHLVEAVLLRDAVLSLRPRRAVMVVPYFAYARQDK